MARSRKSHEDGEEIPKHTGRLPRPYAGKAGGNRYVVYCHRHDALGIASHVLIWSFNEIYAVKWFVNQLIGDGDWDERDEFGARKAAVTDKGIVISMFESQHDLYDILFSRKEMSPLALEWSDPFVAKMIANFKYGRDNADRQAPQDRDDSTPPSVYLHGDAGPPSSDDGGKGKKKRDRGDKPGRSSKAEPRAVRAAKPDGLVTAGALADEIGIEARVLRGALRALGLKKPDFGWAWPKAEAEGIAKQVKKQLKEAKKK